MDENLTPEDIIRLRETILELSDTIEALNKTLGGNNKLTEDNIKRRKEETQSLIDSIEKRKQLRKEEEESHKRQIQLEQEEIEYKNKLKSSYESLQSSIKSLASTLFSAQQGYSKYNKSIEEASNAVNTFASSLGAAGAILGKFVQGIATLATLQLEQADNVLKASDTLSQLGAVGGTTSYELLGLAHNAGLFSKNLDLLTKPVQTLNQSLITLGGTSSQGVKEFAEMADVGEDVRKKFSRLGIGQAELIQAQADYINLQRAAGVQITDNMKKDGALRRASLEYTENLIELAALSGREISDVKKGQEIALAGYATLLQTNRMQQQIAEAEAAGDTERANRLRAEKAARDKLLKTVENQIGQGELLAATQKFLATGVIDETTQSLQGLGIPIHEFAEEIRQGKDVSAEFLEAFREGVDRNNRSIGRSAEILGEQQSKYFGLTTENMLARARMADRDQNEIRERTKEEIEGAAREGFDPAKDIRANLESVERQTRIFADSLLASQNGLLRGYNAQTVAMNIATAALYALAAAAGAALAAQLGGKLLGKRFPGKAGPKPSVPGTPAPGVPGTIPKPDLPSPRTPRTSVPSGYDKTPGGIIVPESVAKETAEKAAKEAAEKVVAKEVTEAAVETGAKSFLKKIPGISLIAGLGFAAGRALEGDLVGAGGELASGVAGTVPGIGTGASFAIDAALAARDINKSQQAQSSTLGTSEQEKTMLERLNDWLSSMINTPSKAAEQSLEQQRLASQDIVKNYSEQSQKALNVLVTKADEVLDVYESEMDKLSILEENAKLTLRGQELDRQLARINQQRQLILELTEKGLQDIREIEQQIHDEEAGTPPGIPQAREPQSEAEKLALARVKDLEKQAQELMLSGGIDAYNGGQISGLAEIQAQLEEARNELLQTQAPKAEQATTDRERTPEEIERIKRNFGFRDGDPRPTGLFAGNRQKAWDIVYGQKEAEATGSTEKAIAEVVDKGPGFTTVKTTEGDVQRREGVRAWRNNNPGNIEFGPFARNKGAIGDDGRFAVFPTKEKGDKAKEDLLFGPKYIDLSIANAISRYAPPNENDTRAYIDYVTKEANADSFTLMRDLTTNQRQDLLSAMAKMEGFKPGKVIELATGGIASGPNTGFPAKLHGNELVKPLDPNSILEKLATTSVTSSASENAITNMFNDNPMKNLESINYQMMQMISNKLDSMIDKLGTSNDIQDRLLKQSSI